VKRPTFTEGTVVAAVASIPGAAIFGALTLTVAAGPVLRVIIAGLSLSYVIYLLNRSGEHVGKITVVTAWIALALMVWWLAPSMPLYLILHVVVIWVIRSLYFHSGILASVADLAVSVLALAAGAAGGIYTGSVFVGIWCFFLTQSLFVFIPSWLAQPDSADAIRARPDRFEIAHRAAEGALRKFSSSN
jgi:hypothetical protein